MLTGEFTSPVEQIVSAFLCNIDKTYDDIETRAECASLLEMMRSASHAFRSWKGRIAPYFQGLTQRAARIKSRMRQALATEELRGAKKIY